MSIEPVSSFADKLQGLEGEFNKAYLDKGGNTFDDRFKNKIGETLELLKQTSPEIKNSREFQAFAKWYSDLKGNLLRKAHIKTISQHLAQTAKLIRTIAKAQEGSSPANIQEGRVAASVVEIEAKAKAEAAAVKTLKKSAVAPAKKTASKTASVAKGVQPRKSVPGSGTHIAGSRSAPSTSRTIVPDRRERKSV